MDRFGRGFCHLIDDQMYSTTH